MAEIQQETKIVLAWELFEQCVLKGHIAKQLAVNPETVRIWIAGSQNHSEGVLGYLEQYRTAKKGKRAKRKVEDF